MNRELQEERTRQYFITAAREIIRGEGMTGISARNVAERAGYSYATLYNYFEDMGDLVFQCAEGFMQECRDLIESQRGDTPRGIEGLKKNTLNYARFFIQYPGIFELLYQEKISDITSGSSNIGQLENFYNSLTSRDWETLPDEVNKTHRKRTGYALHGLLLFYLNRRKSLDYSQLIDEIILLFRDFS